MCCSFTKVSFCVLLWLVISACQYRFPVWLWPGPAVRVSADSVTGGERGREMLPEMLQWGVSCCSFCPHTDMLGLLAFLLLSNNSTLFLGVQHIAVCMCLWLAFIYFHGLSLHIFNVHIGFFVCLFLVVFYFVCFVLNKQMFIQTWVKWRFFLRRILIFSIGNFSLKSSSKVNCFWPVRVRWKLCNSNIGSLVNAALSLLISDRDILLCVNHSSKPIIFHLHNNELPFEFRVLYLW